MCVHNRRLGFILRVAVQLHLVSENVKYLLELMQNQKSDFLEWIIIILIGAEIMVSLFDMFHKIQ